MPGQVYEVKLAQKNDIVGLSRTQQRQIHALVTATQKLVNFFNRGDGDFNILATKLKYFNQSLRDITTDGEKIKQSSPIEQWKILTLIKDNCKFFLAELFEKPEEFTSATTHISNYVKLKREFESSLRKCERISAEQTSTTYALSNFFPDLYQAYKDYDIDIQSSGTPLGKGAWTASKGLILAGLGTGLAISIELAITAAQYGPDARNFSITQVF